MSTRGFVGFVVDNQEKIHILHGDAYPSGFGVDFLHWILANQDAINNRLPGGVVDQVRSLRVVDRDVELDEADAHRIRTLLRDNVGRPNADYFERIGTEELLEIVGCYPEIVLLGGIIADGSDFVTDSLYCEWGYLLDLDASFFEVYRGFQEAPHGSGRFAHWPPAGDDYYPVALIASWPLTGLPDLEAFRNHLAAR